MHFDAGRETGEGEKGGANEAGPFEFNGYGREYVAGELRREITSSDSLKQPFIGRLPDPS